MKTKNLNKEILIKYLDDSFITIQSYMYTKSLNDLYKESMLINALTFRTEVVCRLILKFRNELKDAYDEGDILYLKDLLNLLKDYTKLHSPDLWYFVTKKVPYLKSKIANI